MQIPAKVHQYVDWTTSTLLSSHRQLFILKHSAGIAATGQNMIRQNNRTTDACPQCGSLDEHTEHIIQCTHEEAGRY